MAPLINRERLTDFRSTVTPEPKNPVSLPYELRTEMMWLDFCNPVNPLGTPKSMLQAMHTALIDGELSYTPDHEGHAFRNAVCQYHGLDPDWLLCGGSSFGLINAAAQAYNPHSVGISMPCPIEYINAICNAGHSYVPLQSDLSYATPDFYTARQNVGKFQGALLANPTYPGSRLLPKQVLLHYLESCTWVIVDESLLELCFSGESVIPLCEKYHNLIVIRSTSATFCLPGVPIGYLVSHPSTIKRIRQFYNGSEISMFGEVLAKSFVSETDYLEQTKDFLEKEIPWMQYMLNLLPGISISPAEGNFVLCRIDTSSNVQLCVRCAEELAVRLQLAGFLVCDLTGLPGIKDDKSFVVSVRRRDENEQLLQALNRVLSTRG